MLQDKLLDMNPEAKCHCGGVIYRDDETYGRDETRLVAENNHINEESLTVLL